MRSETERDGHDARPLHTSTQHQLDGSAASQFRALQSVRSNRDQNSISAGPQVDVTNVATAATNPVSMSAMTGLPAVDEGQTPLEQLAARPSDEQAAEQNRNPGESSSGTSDSGESSFKPRARDDTHKLSSSDSTLLEPIAKVAIRR
jgi:hypothetical protein